MEIVGFIGIGNMGTGMVKHLLDIGVPVVIYDVNLKRTSEFEGSKAQIASSTEDVARKASTVFLSLPTPQASREIVADLARGDAVRVVIDLSTIGPLTAQSNAKELSEKQITYIDAPVSGGVTGARDGTLSVMVACDDQAYANNSKLLDAIGRPQHIGRSPGQAQTLKLVNNLMSVTALVITSEAMAMGAKSGIEPDVMINILNKSSGHNSATADKFPRSVLTGTFDYGFSLGLSYKDVSLCIQEAQKMRIPMTVGSLVLQILSIANAVYGPAADFTNLCRLEETWSGMEIRSKSAVD